MLERVKCPTDLKSMSLEDMQILAGDIRRVLINKASTYGGHVGSNLGLVETTIALHYVFNSPVDKFVFDVSHQCYTHKILTGRKDAFTDPAKYATVSGFTNPIESEHDFFRIGHSATSISLACGLAKARDLKGDKENIIAIIGDGALGGGEALEGLNFGGSELNSNLIVLVNDNQMSIAENHGGLYTALDKLRTSNGECKDNIFKALGYEYHYVSDGNNLRDMIDVLSSVKDTNKPVVIHICTIKGKGYNNAENAKEDWHWRRPFDIETGELTNPFNGKSYDTILNDFLLDKMAKDKTVVAFAAGVPLTSGFNKQKRSVAGEQFVDVGIMEEHAIAMLAGAAANGAKPVFTTDCTFYQRVYDQVSQEVCINNLPVTMLVRNATVWGMTDITHLGFFDISLFANIPNLVLLAPTNKDEYVAMLDWSIEQKSHPVMIRIPRFVLDAKYEVITNFEELNKFQVCRKGSKVAVIALGDFFKIGDEVVDMLKESLNIDATLLNPRYASGVDEELLLELTKDHDVFITLEDGIIEGGFGEKISGFLGDKRGIVVKNYGLKKEFLDRYKADEVLTDNHLRSEMIVSEIKEML